MRDVESKYPFPSFINKITMNWQARYNFCNFTKYDFYPTALKGCRGIVFTHGVRMGGRVAGNSLSGLYLGNCKVWEVDIW